MTDLATMLVEDAVEDKAIEIARNALREGAAIEFIRKITGLVLNNVNKPTIADEKTHQK